MSDVDPSVHRAGVPRCGVLAGAGYYAYHKGIEALIAAKPTQSEFTVSGATTVEQDDPLLSELVLSELDDTYQSEKALAFLVASSTTCRLEALGVHQVLRRSLCTLLVATQRRRYANLTSWKFWCNISHSRGLK